MVDLNLFPDASCSRPDELKSFIYIFHMHTCEKSLLIRAIERSWGTILKCLSLIGTAMIVVWISTMSPIRKFVGVVGWKLVMDILVNLNWHRIDQPTEVESCLGAYNIKPYCPWYAHRYRSALKTEFPWDPPPMGMEFEHNMGHRVVKWSSGCRSLSWNMWWNYRVWIPPTYVPEIVEWIVHGFDED